MPILSFRANVQRSGPSGPIQLPPQEGLWRRGPIVQITVGLSHASAQHLLSKGQTVPAPIGGRALIDTGAHSTCVDAQVAQRLGLPTVDVVSVATPSHASSEHQVHPVQLELVGTDIQFTVARAIGATLGNQGIVVLVGRDVLRHCVMFYNGVSGDVTLATG